MVFCLTIASRLPSGDHARTPFAKADDKGGGDGTFPKRGFPSKSTNRNAMNAGPLVFGNKYATACSDGLRAGSVATPMVGSRFTCPSATVTLNRGRPAFVGRGFG